MSQNANGVVWDLTSYFPEFGGKDMADFKATLERDIEALETMAASLDVLTDENAEEWEKVFLTAEELITRVSHISSYVGCVSSADASNESYTMEEGRLAKLFAF